MTMLWVLCTPVQTAIQLMMFGEHFHLKYVGEKISWGIILSDGREISLQWLKHAVLVFDTNTQSKHKPLITLPTCGILCVTRYFKYKRSFNKRSFIVRNQLLWSKQVIPLTARSQSEGAILKSSNNLTCGPQTSLRPGALSRASSGTSCNFWLNSFHCPLSYLPHHCSYRQAVQSACRRATGSWTTSFRNLKTVAWQESL